MNSNQFKLIIDKIDKLDMKHLEHDGHYSNKINNVMASFNGGKIKISSNGLYRNCLDIKIQSNKSIAAYAEVSIKYPLGIKWFSISWHRWRSTCRRIENKVKVIKKEEMIKQKEKEEKAKEEELIKIEELIIEVFPEILEDALIGDDDD